VFVCALSAQTLKPGLYAVVRGDLLLRFHANGSFQGHTSANQNAVIAKGTYRINGSRLTLAFDQASGGFFPMRMHRGFLAKT
jgi:hypothetical protein